MVGWPPIRLMNVLCVGLGCSGLHLLMTLQSAGRWLSGSADLRWAHSHARGPRAALGSSRLGDHGSLPCYMTSQQVSLNTFSRGRSLCLNYVCKHPIGQSKSPVWTQRQGWGRPLRPRVRGHCQFTRQSCVLGPLILPAYQRTTLGGFLTYSACDLFLWVWYSIKGWRGKMYMGDTGMWNRLVWLENGGGVWLVTGAWTSSVFSKDHSRCGEYSVWRGEWRKAGRFQSRLGKLGNVLDSAERF